MNSFLKKLESKKTLINTLFDTLSITEQSNFPQITHLIEKILEYVQGDRAYIVNFINNDKQISVDHKVFSKNVSDFKYMDELQPKNFQYIVDRLLDKPYYFVYDWNSFEGKLRKLTDVFQFQKVCSSIIFPVKSSKDEIEGLLFIDSLTDFRVWFKEEIELTGMVCDLIFGYLSNVEKIDVLKRISDLSDMYVMITDNQLNIKTVSSNLESTLNQVDYSFSGKKIYDYVDNRDGDGSINVENFNIKLKFLRVFGIESYIVHLFEKSHTVSKEDNYIFSSPEPFFALDEKMNLIECNDSFSNLIGFNTEVLSDIDILKLIPENQKSKFNEIFDKCLTETSSQGVILFKKESGNTVLLSVQTILHENGRVLCFVRDNSIINEKNEKTKDSKFILDLLLEKSQYGKIIMDRSGKVKKMNKHAVRFLDISENFQSSDKNIFNMLNISVIDRERLFSGEDVESIVRMKNNRVHGIFKINMKSSVWDDEDIFFIEISDVSKLFIFQEKLKRNDMFIKKIIEEFSAPVCRISSAGNVLGFNRKYDIYFKEKGMLDHSKIFLPLFDGNTGEFNDIFIKNSGSEFEKVLRFIDKNNNAINQRWKFINIFSDSNENKETNEYIVVGMHIF